MFSWHPFETSATELFSSKSSESKQECFSCGVFTNQLLQGPSQLQQVQLPRPLLVLMCFQGVGNSFGCLCA